MYELLAPRLPLSVLSAVMIVIAWVRRVLEFILLLLPGRPAARPARHLRRTSLAHRKPLTSE